MALFPSYADINYGVTVSDEMQFKTLFSNYDDLGEERRKRKWMFPKRNVTLQYEYLSMTDARTIFQFYIDRSGAYEAFTFFKVDVETFENEYVGTGDGSSIIFNLPCRYSSARTIYLNSVEQTITTDYTYSALGGLDDCDEITFNSAPNDGERITIDFTGQLKLRCRFKEDNLSFDTFNNKLRNFGIELFGLLNS